MICLRDVVAVQPKSKIKAGEGLSDGKYKFFTSSNIQSKWLNEYQYDKPALIFGTGGMPSVHFCNTPFSASTDCIVMYAATGINLAMIYNYLSSNMHFLEEGFHGIGLKHISKDYILNLEIPEMNKQTQCKIVTIADKLNNLIALRKLQLSNLDELIKSQFIVMFKHGNYPIVKASNVCDFITKGTTPPTNEIKNQPKHDSIPYLKVYNLSFDGRLLFHKEPQYISRQIHEGKLTRSKVYPNDVLMNIVGPPLGKFALVDDEYPELNINQAIAIFRAKEAVLPTFLLHALMQPDVLQPFLEKAVGIRQLNLSLEQCRDLEFPLPPLEHQQQFATFVKQVDKSKFEIQKSLEKLETLKKALMQQYFG